MRSKPASQLAAEALLGSLRPEQHTPALESLSEVAGRSVRLSTRAARPGTARTSLVERKRVASSSTDPVELGALVAKESARTVLALVVDNPATARETLGQAVTKLCTRSSQPTLLEVVERVPFEVVMRAVATSGQLKGNSDLALGLLHSAGRSPARKMGEKLSALVEHFDTAALSRALFFWSEDLRRPISSLKALRSSSPVLARNLLLYLVCTGRTLLTVELCETYLVGVGLVDEALSSSMSILMARSSRDLRVSSEAAQLILGLTDPGLLFLALSPSLTELQVSSVLRAAEPRLLRHVAGIDPSSSTLSRMVALRDELQTRPPEVQMSVSFLALAGNLKHVKDGGEELGDLVISFLRCKHLQNKSRMFEDETFLSYLLNQWDSAPPQGFLSNLSSSEREVVTSVIFREIYYLDILDVSDVEGMLLDLPGAYAAWSTMGRCNHKNIVGRLFYSHLESVLQGSKVGWEVAMSLALEHEGSVRDLALSASLLSQGAPDSSNL